MTMKHEAYGDGHFVPRPTFGESGIRVITATPETASTGQFVKPCHKPSGMSGGMADTGMKYQKAVRRPRRMPNGKEDQTHLEQQQGYDEFSTGQINAELEEDAWECGEEFIPLDNEEKAMFQMLLDDYTDGESSNVF